MPPAALPAASPASAWTEWDEMRPRDFTARFPRRTNTVRPQPKRRWALGTGALAAVALPALAAPEQWSRFEIADATATDPIVSPMPFEQAGASFPGSAFYYLTAEEPVLKIGEGIHSDAEAPAPGGSLQTGPAARPLRVDNSGVDRTRALQCMTAAIYYEAASEPDAGQRAVAQVVLNRVAHPAYPNTICGVVYQGSERSTGCQFSFTCDGSLARRPSALFWNRAETVARQALAGYVYRPAGLATHYHTFQVHPYWAPSLHYLGTIGAHLFYSFNGAAGRPGAFRYSYFGGEPMAAPHPRAESPDAYFTAIDPVAVQKAFDLKVQTGTAAVPEAAAPPPTYTADLRERGGDSVYKARNLPEANGIKPEYANSGKWIVQPGT